MKTIIKNLKIDLVEIVKELKAGDDVAGNVKLLNNLEVAFIDRIVDATDELAQVELPDGGHE